MSHLLPCFDDFEGMIETCNNYTQRAHFIRGFQLRLKSLD